MSDIKKINFKITDRDKWPLLKKKIKELNFIRLDHYRESFVIRRIEVRIRSLRINSLMDYLKVLDKNEDEQQKLKKELGIHVTHFFRDASAFKALENKVLPLMIKEKEAKKNKKIKIWSAGCSSGEEPYTVAILLMKNLGLKIKNFDITIQANDIDYETILKAKEGVYLEQQLKETDPNIIEKYFIKVGNEYRVKASVKELVKFEVGDVLQMKKPKDCDIVLCRNTVIYFDDQAKANLYMDIHKDVLKKNGFFMLGKTETLVGPSVKLFEIFDRNERIYQKVKDDILFYHP